MSYYALVGQSIVSSSYNPLNLDITIDSSGRVSVVFQSNVNGAYEVFYTESSDDGINWSTPKVISTENFTSTDGIESTVPRIDSWSKEVFVVWRDKSYNNVNEVFYRKLTDDKWGSIEIISDTDEIISSNPDIAVRPLDGGEATSEVFVTWQDMKDGHFEIYRTFFSTDATNESIIKSNIGRFSQPDSFSSTNPAVSADKRSDNFIVTWMDSRDGQPEIYYKESSGSIITDTIVSSNDGFNSQLPAIAINSNNIQFAWEDYKFYGPHKVDYATRSFSLNGTGDSIDYHTLDNNENNARRPALTADSSGNFHLVWQEDTGGSYNIYYSKRDNSGWSSAMKLTDNAENSEYPAAVASGINDSGVYIVWLESNQIYYIHLPSGGVSSNTPQITEMSPSDGDTDVSTAIIPSILFDKSLDPSTVTIKSVKLFMDTSSVQVSGDVKISDNDKKIVFYPGNSLTGGIKYRLDLSPSITSSDGYPIASTSIRFTVSSSESTTVTAGIKVEDVKLYRQGSSIAFQYKLDYSPSDSISNVTIKIYTLSGRLVKRIDDASFTSTTSTTVWDGYGRKGNKVSNGIYLFKIIAELTNGEKDRFSGKFLVAD